MFLVEKEKVDSPPNFARDVVQLIFSGHKVYPNNGLCGNVKTCGYHESVILEDGNLAGKLQEK